MFFISFLFDHASRILHVRVFILLFISYFVFEQIYSRFKICIIFGEVVQTIHLVFYLSYFCCLLLDGSIQLCNCILMFVLAHIILLSFFVKGLLLFIKRGLHFIHHRSCFRLVLLQHINGWLQTLNVRLGVADFSL